MNAREILEQAVREEVSDIFIVAGLPVSCRKNGNIIQTQEEKLFPKEKWGALHLQFIYYGRTFCKAHTCKTPETMCEICAAINAKK